MDNNTPQQLYPKLLDITRSLFPQGKEVKPPPEDIAAVFAELKHTLEPHAPDVVVFALRYRDESLRKLLGTGTDEALDYIKYGLNSEEADSQRTAVEILGTIDSSAALGALEYALLGCKDINVRSSAAFYICLKGDPGIDIIARAASNENQDIRLAVIGGVYQFFINVKVWFEPNWQPENDHQRFLIGVLKKALNDEYPEIRRRAIDVLTINRQITFNEIEQSLRDSDKMVREQAVMALFHNDSIAKREYYLLIASALEDVHSAVSAAALKLLRREGIHKVDVEPFIDSIIDQIVVRASGQPNIDFNPDIVNEVIQLAINVSPRVKNQVLLKLCDLAFQNDLDIRERAIQVVAKVDRDDFLRRVRLRADKQPDIANQILYQLGQAGLGPTQSSSLKQYTEQLADLEKRSLARWDEIAKQSESNFRFRNVLTAVFFAVSLIVLGAGLVAFFAAKDTVTQGLGAAMSAVTVLAGMWYRAWQAPVGDIRDSFVQQAAVETTFMGFMNRTGQVRLLFQQQYATGEMSLDELGKYQKMIADAQAQTAQELALLKSKDQK